MKKQELIANVKAGRAALLNAIQGLSDDILLRPFAVGVWSIKDVLAHLAVWESELITALAGLDQPNKVPHIVEIEDFDEFNDEQYRVNVRRPLDIIREDFEGVHVQLIKMIERLDEQMLNDGRRFKWLMGEPAWTLIEENSYLHEQEHAMDIIRWRKEQNL
jgi:hypothetical protein